jgi:hypothetical protein
MKTIFVGPQGIRAGWRFAIFVFLLFGFSKLFFWLLTVLAHYQEHPGWFPTDFLFDGMSKLERRPFLEYGLPWRPMFRKHFWQGALWGLAASSLMINSAQAIRRRFFRGRGTAWANFGQIRLALGGSLPVARLR